MATSYDGRIARIAFAASPCPSNKRLLAHLLERTDGVISFHIDSDERVLTAYLEPGVAEDGDLVRALVASGMFPAAVSGAPLGGDPNAC